ncbi:hypothetical protein CERZMDRAFT_92916 [Cercospora zeae-maydis SCOH1-5]|uniref:Uncharacterized protein n=1 Tax=Cercospora zeae-maydis SCOH1-5 TaxID=717836 RepID=A0A6A6FU42_9PEZI|nr:hypothetical protein CERZMDRAFT_92916 [Cercospora zeae-maydis SCOH1-5]
MSSQTPGDNRSFRSSGVDRASSATSLTSSNTKISVYEADLARQLLEYNNYFGPGASVRPGNEAELRARLSQYRRSLSPSRYSDSKFRDFEQVNADCKNEDEVVSRVITPYFTDYFRSRQGYGRDTYAQNTQMKNLKPLCNKGTSEMKDLKPDFCRGVAPNDVDQELLRSNLRGTIQGKKGGPVAVNDFLDVKGPDGSNKVLEVQATQNGSAGARAMHHLRTYGLHAGTEADGIARSFSMTYNAGTIVPYVSHVHPPADVDGQETTYTTRIGGEYMLGSPAQFRAGLTLYRNATEEAYRYRRESVEAANARASTSREQARQMPVSTDWVQPRTTAVTEGSRRSISDVDQHSSQGDRSAKRIQRGTDQNGEMPLTQEDFEVWAQGLRRCVRASAENRVSSLPPGIVTGDRPSGQREYFWRIYAAVIKEAEDCEGTMQAFNNDVDLLEIIVVLDK